METLMCKKHSKSGRPRLPRSKLLISRRRRRSARATKALLVSPLRPVCRSWAMRVSSGTQARAGAALRTRDMGEYLERATPHCGGDLPICRAGAGSGPRRPFLSSAPGRVRAGASCPSERRSPPAADCAAAHLAPRLSAAGVVQGLRPCMLGRRTTTTTRCNAALSSQGLGPLALDPVDRRLASVQENMQSQTEDDRSLGPRGRATRHPGLAYDGFGRYP